ncbi:cytochrome P450 [Trametes versicolor FP-101664 SS1]|uniref:cytochrome P450 n=1 Tax=Trametes versicolor (strain FP-101664) TaxID=717944 RepID=UPI0004622195|nr:cytochrome P450 [Trametes versicolor FP-101664 SS1]EIW62554.1 cytochrome P450 [Trametes versicolor FP-101664 SS1]
MKEIAAMDNTLLPDTWFKRYGKVFVDREFLMRPRLWSLDPRAMQHVLSHPNDFPPPEETQQALQMVLGRGLLSVSGEEHRKQRRILNPAFGPAQVRDLTHIFVEKSIQLREYWANVVRSGSTRVNVNKDLSKLTLDIIGVAGFGYDFNTLNPEGKPNELSLAFSRLFMSSPSISALVPFLRTLFPILKLIRTERVATIEAASEVFHRVGMQLVEERKTAILKEMSEKHLQGVERKDLQGHDLLTLLMRANMAKDVPENQRLSDKEVLDQIPTFLLAGHETTSTSSTWALCALSKNPALQKKLREELFTVQSDTPTMEELSALPYLDAVVTETLRLYTPATMSFRVASKDSVIPLSEPFTDCHGKVHNELRVAKGNKVVIPILAMNRSAEIWGQDAMEFRPERWQQPPEAISAIPGVWGHLLTFIGGPRACIGFRFSLIELKAILFTLIRAFEFELAVPAEDIVAKTEGLQRPSLLSEPEKRYQLPLLVKPYSTS